MKIKEKNAVDEQRQKLRKMVSEFLLSMAASGALPPKQVHAVYVGIIMHDPGSIQCAKDAAIEHAISKNLFPESERDFFKTAMNVTTWEDFWNYTRAFDLNDYQIKAFELLEWWYLMINKGDEVSGLMKLILSPQNNLLRYLKNSDDLIARSQFDFSPIEAY